jgi:hypothetical protein
MDISEIVNGTVDVMIDRFKPLDEDAYHRRTKLSALFPIAANFPIEALTVDPLTRFQHRAIQHSRQFFVSHPNLRHGYLFENFDRGPTTRSKNRCSWHKHFKSRLNGFSVPKSDGSLQFRMRIQTMP